MSLKESLIQEPGPDAGFPKTTVAVLSPQHVMEAVAMRTTFTRAHLSPRKRQVIEQAIKATNFQGFQVPLNQREFIALTQDVIGNGRHLAVKPGERAEPPDLDRLHRPSFEEVRDMSSYIGGQAASYATTHHIAIAA